MLSYCSDKPLWLAVQDGDGSWTRVFPVNEGRYEVTFRSTRGGVAAVFSGGTSLQVIYGDLTELATIACDYGDKYVSGKFSALTWPQYTTITLGASTRFIQAPRDSFEFWSVAAGPQDLIAVRRSEEDPKPDRIVIRRALDPPTNSRLPMIDFDAEGFAPTIGNFSVSNVGSTPYTDLSSWWYGRGAAQTYFTLGGLEGATTGQYVAVPLEKLGPDELSSLTLVATDLPASTRYMVRYFREPVDMALSLGPTLAAPVVSVPPSGTYVHPRIQLPSQAEYDRMAYANFGQSGDGVTVAMTSSYLGGAPSTWTLEVPDLSSVDGWNDAWGLSSGTEITWSLVAEGGVDRKLGDVAHDGDLFTSAYLNGSIAAAGPSARSTASLEPHRGGFPRISATGTE